MGYYEQKERLERGEPAPWFAIPTPIFQEAYARWSGEEPSPKRMYRAMWDIEHGTAHDAALAAEDDLSVFMHEEEGDG